MLLNPARLAIAAMSALAFIAQPAFGQNITRFKPPALIPFVHIDLFVEASTYVNATNGIQTGQANNQGGNFTGAISGKVLKLGTEFETFPLAANGTESTYDNIFTLNTTDGTPLLLSVSGHIHYTPPKLLGFARMEFSTSSPKYQYLSYGDYVAEFEATFPSGRVSVDVFELKSAGHY
ncbi:uncharacterized protein BDZ99DRAFT_467809 [Mytilinidion resinicola]|uniref:Uncharacterized protein n=1 Tax=Mytilinidion resinicola TaxID=574789 RepID=A0A6A6Y6H3_9PEZI|nr:uncharacterized protein BDZ99DRAFT_467809 [Mytilinidion resinicola]KAF2804123.1 hypothetical protein BDZ99DRAFT_467809 [Mytilinidion resinicola]